MVWRPPPGIVERGNLRHFMDQHGIGSLDELQQRSTTDLEWFWNAVLHGLDVRFYERYERVIDLSQVCSEDARYITGQVLHVNDAGTDVRGGHPRICDR